MLSLSLKPMTGQLNSFSNLEDAQMGLLPSHAEMNE